jgi:S1-C subfamily serine protease
MKHLKEALFATFLACGMSLAPVSPGSVDNLGPGPAGLRWQAWSEAAQTSPASVLLIAGKGYNGGWVTGTCFYVQRPAGRYIITADHVVESAAPMTVAARVRDVWVPLRIVNEDIGTDLAALKPKQ